MSPNEAMKDFSIQDFNSLNINNGDRVAIELPKNKLVENDELIGQLMAKINENVSNAMFLLTGRRNSFEGDQSDDQHLVNHRFRRQALDKKAAKPAKSDDIKRLVNKDDCLYFYTRSVAVHTKSINNSSVLIASFDTLRFQPTLGDTKCWENKDKDTEQEPALLDLTYQKTDAKLVLKLRIGSNKK